MTTQAKLNQTPPSVTMTQSGAYRLVYSNVFRYKIGPGDLNLTFSTVSDSPLGGNTVEDQISVVLSWPQLKMLTHVLNQIVSGIEAETDSVIPVIPNAGFEQDIKEHSRLGVRSFKLIY